MSWAVGFDSYWQRDIGYGVPATCDQPGCGEEIDRGLGYVCGNEPYGGDRGCGLYFCGKHQVGRWQRCTRCTNYRTPHKATPDVREWIEHKLTDESWEQWRIENPKQVAELRSHLAQPTKARSDDGSPARPGRGQVKKKESP